MVVWASEGGSAQPSILTGERGSVYRATGGAVAFDKVTTLDHKLDGTRDGEHTVERGE